ncbi:MAG: hypothetical protein U9O94_08360 [Nanoarchaeota archaeon]|nr:hypothetical protein [Nanoarchaeota archaeon]
MKEDIKYFLMYEKNEALLFLKGIFSNYDFWAVSCLILSFISITNGFNLLASWLIFLGLILYTSKRLRKFRHQRFSFRINEPPIWRAMIAVSFFFMMVGTIIHDLVIILIFFCCSVYSLLAYEWTKGHWRYSLKNNKRD